MAIRAETYAPTRPVPYLLERTYAQTITCPVRSTAAGALVEPSSGKITVTRPDGTALVSGAAVTVSSSVASYVLTVSASEALGEGWTVVWALVIDAETYTFRLAAILCEYVPPNMITAADLYGGEGIPELRYAVPQAQGDRGDRTGWAPQIDAAYYSFIRRLLSDGRPVWLVREPTGYREWLLATAIKLACDAVPAAQGSIWETYRKDAWHRVRHAEAALKLQYSDASIGRRSAGEPVIWLAPVGRSRW
jgi:hypothetical protein